MNLKRLLRPLLSKIHSLNDTFAKCSDLLDFDFDSLTIPIDSNDRLSNLRHHVPEPLFQAYTEIFQIVRTILAALDKRDKEMSARAGRNGRALGEKKAHRQDIPISLSALCAIHVGSAAVLSTKSTYFRLSQALLFDQDGIEPHLQLFSEGLANDLDDWLDMDHISSHSSHFVIGYLVRLLATYSNSTLYLVVPVLIQWAWERKSSRVHFTFYRALFHDFWLYDDADLSDTLVGLISLRRRLFCHRDTFWALLHRGYWDFVGNLGVGTFESLLVATLAVNGKLDDVCWHGSRIDFVYRALTAVPQHRDANTVLGLVLQSIVRARNERFCASRLVEFASFWLFGSLYNSVYPGNEAMFNGVIKMSEYLADEEDEANSTTETNDSDGFENDSGESTDTDYSCTKDPKDNGRTPDRPNVNCPTKSQSYQNVSLYRRNNSISVEFPVNMYNFGQLVRHLRSYFLDTTCERVSNVAVMSELLVAIQRDKNNDFDGYVEWLYMNGEVEMAEACSERYYERF